MRSFSLILAALLLSIAACTQAELIFSYDFEQGTDPSVYEGLRFSNATPEIVPAGMGREGQCMKISSVTPSRYCQLTIQRPMTLDKNLVLTFDHREEIEEGKDAAYLGLLFFDKDDKQWFGSDKFTPEWKTAEIVVAQLRSPNDGVLTLGKVLQRLNLYGRAQGDTNALMTVWLDNIRLETRPFTGTLSKERRVSTANPPLFNWTAGEGEMRLEYSQDATFPDEGTVKVATTVNYHTPAEPMKPGDWYWRVWTRDELTEGYSDASTIEITPEAHRFKTAPVPTGDITSRPRPWVIPAKEAQEAAKPELIRKAEGLYRQGVPDDPPPYEEGNPDWPTWIDWYGKVHGGITSATGRRLQSMSQAYVETRDPKVRDMLKEMAFKAAAWDPEGGSEMRRGDIGAHHLLRGLNWCYDALHDDLTDQERTQLRDVIVTRADQFWKALNPFPGGGSEFNNHAWLKAFGLGETGLVLLGEYEGAEQWAEYVRQLYIGRFLCALGYQGDNNEGISYWGYGLWFVIDYADMMKHVCDIDLFQHPWLFQTARFPMYTAPPGAWAVSFADTGKPNHGTKGPSQASHVRNLALRTRDPYALWYGGASGETDGLLPRPPVDLPQSIHYKFIGWTIHNTTLVDGNDGVTLAMRSGPFYAGHQHEDQNSFVINAYGEKLAIDSGYYDWYGSDHFNQYSTLTRAHNAILVNEEDQHSRRKGADGRIAAYFDSPAYGYSVGDVSDPDIYSGQLSRWDRRALFIKPGFVIVHDLIDAADGPGRYDWLLHTVAPIDTDADTASFSFVSGKAALRGRFVTPADLKLEVTKGYPVEPVDGYSTRPVPPESYAHEWTLTATPQAKRQTEDFVAAMQIQRVEEPSADAQFENLQTAEAIGVRVSVDDQTHTVLFRRRGVTGAIVCDEIETDGECVAVATDAEGRVLRAFASGASYLTYSGEPIFRTSDETPAGASLLRTEAGYMLNISLSRPAKVTVGAIGGEGGSILIDGKHPPIPAPMGLSVSAPGLEFIRSADLDADLKTKGPAIIGAGRTDDETMVARGGVTLTSDLTAGNHTFIWGMQSEQVDSHALPAVDISGGNVQGYAQRRADGLVRYWWGQFQIDKDDRYEIALEGWDGKLPPLVIRDGEPATLELRDGTARGEVWLSKGAHFLTISGQGSLTDIRLRGLETKKSASRMLPGDFQLAEGSVVIEAEGVSAEGAVKGTIMDKVGASGGVAHCVWDTDGQWAEWEFQAPQDGDYELLVRGCSEYNDILRNLKLDGNAFAPNVDVATFGSTGGWCRTQDDWRYFLVRGEGDQPAIAHLSAGKHVLRMERISGSMNIDLLALRPVTQK